MHELLWIMIFRSQVRQFASNFHEWQSHEWKLLANCFKGDLKIFIHGNECIILFLKSYFMSWTHDSTKNNYGSLILPLSLRTVFSDLDCDVTTVDLWLHASVGYWHCDVISIECSCMCKLVQRRSSLVNNNHEYWFLTTGIHGLACKKSTLCNISWPRIINDVLITGEMLSNMKQGTLTPTTKL